MKKMALFIALALMCCSAVAQDIREALQQVQQALLWTDYFYVDSVNSSELAANAIKGMLKELDPHSAYMSPDEVKAANIDLGGNFEGIGVMYQMEHDTLLVISPVIGGPSEKVGIMAGDQIVFVNDTTIAGCKLSTQQIQSRLRGPKGTIVRLGIMREGERIDFVVERDKIPVYSVDATYMVTPETGYIKISRFAQTTPDELTTAMETLQAQGMKHLILDLQGNGGGYLQSAVEMARNFLKQNDLVVYTQGRHEPRRNHMVTTNGNFDGRLVIIIDEESASASEILAGAMQDLDRGVIVGRRSFGKGLVQRPIDLPGGAMIRLTIAHYYTPSGRCIQKPYEKGHGDDYRKDLLTRYNKGEFVSADSIHFADSLKCYTRAGRIVYSGGGIMPDVFVPLDTTKMAKTHRNLIAKGSWNRYILDYFRQNQKALKRKYTTFEAFDEQYEVSDQMIWDLCQQGNEKDNVKIDTLEITKSLDIMKLQLKANLANDLFKEGAYNRIMNRRIPSFKQAIEIISDEKRYQKLLSSKN